MHRRRRRRDLFTLPGLACGLCGHGEAVITVVRTVRQGLAWMNPFWSPEVELFEVRASCAARRLMDAPRRMTSRAPSTCRSAFRVAEFRV